MFKYAMGLSFSTEDHPYELAFYLDLLQTHAFPRWPEIYAIAEQTMTRLHRADVDLYLHLHKCSTTNVKVDPKVIRFE